ncbi:MAG: hypothetical protein ACF8R7_11150, partial [Phycisphaerales bacterium JB039]
MNRIRTACLAGLPVVATVALAQQAPTDPPYIEWRDMGPIAPGPARAGPPGDTSGPLDIPPSVQVNVDEFGMDILGDAANEPSIAIDPTAPNRIAIGWRQFDTIASNFRQAGIGWSNDGGRTWRAGTLDRGTFRSDPVLAADGLGRFYYYSLQESFVCDMFISDDGGQSWTSPIPAYGGDKAWIAVDRTGTASDGALYAFWDHYGCCEDDWFTRSFDRGASFERPVPIAGQPIWGTVDYLPDGDLLIAGRKLSTGREFVVARSDTAKLVGMTPAFSVSEPNLGGVFLYFVGGTPNPGGLLGQVWVATDRSGGPAHGNAYVLSSVDPPGDDPMDVMFTRSEDGGLTWSAPVRINDDAGKNWQWFGTMSVAPNGRIDVIWNDTRDSGVENLSALYYSSSDDGGRTWSANQKLSDTFDSHIGRPQQNKLG